MIFELSKEYYSIQIQTQRTTSLHLHYALSLMRNSNVAFGVVFNHSYNGGRSFIKLKSLVLKSTLKHSFSVS